MDLALEIFEEAISGIGGLFLAEMDNSLISKYQLTIVTLGRSLLMTAYPITLNQGSSSPKKDHGKVYLGQSL